MSSYGVIYADPPWMYRDKALAGKRGASSKYDCMTFEQLVCMRSLIDDFAADDCYLFMWAPTTHTLEAKNLIKAWGFRPLKQRAFTWVKINKDRSIFMGMGTLTRSNSEDVWCGVRGKPKRASASVRSVVLAQRREHSRKPDEVAESIECLCGDVRRIELFARESRAGWDSWGDQRTLFDAKP